MNPQSVFRPLTLLLFWISLTFPALAKPPVDLADDWLRAWEHTQGWSGPERVSYFEANVIAKAPRLYEELFSYTEGDPAERLDKHLNLFPSIQANFESLHENLELIPYLESFSETFPSFDPDTIDIYIIHSLGGSNGALLPVDDRTVFYLGLDMMVLHNRYKDQRPFFHHEFFHGYHLQHFTPDSRLFNYLWMEGLAVFISRRLNPDATLEQLQLSPQMVAECNADLERLVRTLEADLTSTETAVRRQYFYLDAPSSGLPNRCGYYLGLLLVEEVARSRSLEEVISMQSDEVLVALREAIPNILK